MLYRELEQVTGALDEQAEGLVSMLAMLQSGAERDEIRRRPVIRRRKTGDAMRIYIASKTKHAARWVLLRRLGAPIVSTWIDEAGDGASPDIPDLAMRCIREAATADRVVLYCEPGELHKGTLIEVGAALASGVPVYCVGWCDSMSDTFARHPLWHVAESVEAAIGRPMRAALSSAATGEGEVGR